MKADNSPPRGNRDLLPAATAVRDHVFSTIKDVYAKYGYARIETPALEDITRLTGGQGGENEKLIYQVLKRGLEEPITAQSARELVDLGLRFDLTVPLTRFYGNNHATLGTPFRSFQFGPVWRAERPQKGRYRQFYQCDIDLIGEQSVLAEAELIEATTEAIKAVGLADVTVRLSDRRFLSALAEGVGVPAEAWNTFFIGLDKLDKIGWDGVRAELVDSRGLPASAVDSARERIESLGGLGADKIGQALADALPGMPEEVIADLATTTACVDALGDVRWEFDPTLVRGMGYYTGQIFELHHPASAGSVGGGGRYDGLIGRTLGRDVPACGFSIGFERIVDLLGAEPKQDNIAVLFETDTPLPLVLQATRDLRERGHGATAIRRSGKFGAQLTRLETAGYTRFTALKADSDPAALEIRPLG
ncbi:histidine--tRNA ligase [Pseudonocardiaceae bacterium YIM PH 21723]|nr:histidine--tRNA ligase [Pseudonocardiaceae bacterium YIM PH 21723]